MIYNNTGRIVTTALPLSSDHPSVRWGALIELSPDIYKSVDVINARNNYINIYTVLEYHEIDVACEDFILPSKIRL